MIGWRLTDIPSNASYPHSQDANHCFGVKSWSWLACWVRVSHPRNILMRQQLPTVFFFPRFLKYHRSTAVRIVWQQKPTQKKTRPLQVFCTRRSCQTYQHLPMEERRGGRAPNPLKYSLVGQKKGFEIINTSKKQHQNLLLGHITDEWYGSQKYCLYTCITQGSLLKGIWFCPSESTLMQLLKPGGTLGLPWSCCPEHWHKSSDTNIPNAGQMNLKFRIMPLIFKKNPQNSTSWLFLVNLPTPSTCLKYLVFELVLLDFFHHFCWELLFSDNLCPHVFGRMKKSEGC